MKLVTVLLGCLLFACNSPQEKKEAIVERQKDIIKEIEALKIEALERHRFQDSLARAIQKAGLNGKLPVIDDRSDTIYVSPYTKMEWLQKEYDSLEFELKKY
jgi:hypothetical protein